MTIEYRSPKGKLHILKWLNILKWQHILSLALVSLETLPPGANVRITNKLYIET